MLFIASFILGFLTCLIIIIIYNNSYNKRYYENELKTNSKIKIQNKINQLYNSKENSLYIIIPENGFRFTIRKVFHKSTPNDLNLEIRNNFYNKQFYNKLLDFIKDTEYSFTEKFTPKTNKQQSFTIKFQGTGILCIKPITDLIFKFSEMILERSSFELMVGFSDPILWKNTPEILNK